MKQTNLSIERYQRQMILGGFGETGQKRLLNAKVLVVGAGGLGCPALQYLAAAGVGTIGIVDDDKVSLHNLHRQVLYTTADVGLLKVEVAAKHLADMNPDVKIKPYAVRLTPQNAIAIVRDYHFVLDATDNFATRYLINDTCVLLCKPLVYGAISQFEGQVAVFNADENSVNYRDLFPYPPHPGTASNCAEAGVLGVLPGMIGTLQAAEVIKLIVGLGKPLVNQLLTYNALTHESFVFELTHKPETASLMPGTEAELLQRHEERQEPGPCRKPTMAEIDGFLFDLLRQSKNTMVIDVREMDEQPVVTEFIHKKVPLHSIDTTMAALPADTVIFFCQSGMRSQEAARRFLANCDSRKKVYSLRGGILQWKKEHNGKEA